MGDDKNDANLDWLYRRDDPPATQVFRNEQPPAWDQRSSSGEPTGRQGYPEPAVGYTPPPAGVYPEQPRPQPATSPLPPAPQQPPASQRPATPSAIPRPRQRGRRRRLSPLKIISLLLAAWVLYLIVVPAYAWVAVASIPATPDGDRPADQPGTTVLLVGSDGRDKLTEEQRGELGTGDTEGRRTDTIILLHQPKSGKPAMISLPRDSWVNVPGKGEAKLNASYAWGGAPLLVETIEKNTGIRIDGYLEVGFLGVVEAVDAVGGIEVCPEKAISDRDSHLELPAGCQTLNGKTALSYVRMRKADPTGDIGRMGRQREVIGKVMKKAISPMTFINPVTYWQLNMAAAHTLGRGDSTGPGEMLGGVQVFAASATGGGLSIVVPVADANAHRDGQSVMLWDRAASQKLFDAVKAGDTRSLSSSS